MVARATSRSIFNGTDEIISSVLGLGPGKNLKQKSTCRQLIPSDLSRLDFITLVSDLYSRMENNLTDRTPSIENWRIERQTKLSLRNRSPEVLLERAIVLLSKRGILNDWFNQIPVASGLIDEGADKRAAIDLLRFRNERAVLVELKWKSDTPAYAAIEILRYGLAYMLSYVNRKRFGYEDNPLMQAKRVSLRVLAPHEYYNDCDMSWLGSGINEGVRVLAERKTNQAFTMDFGYLAFPSGFSMPFTTGEEVLRLRNVEDGTAPLGSLTTAIRNLEPIWWNPDADFL